MQLEPAGVSLRAVQLPPLHWSLTTAAPSGRLLANRRLSEMELGLVASLAIETADEAKKLVPSLAAPTEVRHMGCRLLLLLLPAGHPSCGDTLQFLMPLPCCGRKQL